MGGEGSGSTYTVDTTAIESMMTGVSSSIGDFVTAALPILGGIACAVLVFYLGRFAFRLIKSWMSAGK